MKNLLLFSLPTLFLSGCNEPKKEKKSPTLAPFSNVDTLAINDWWNRNDNPIINLKVLQDSAIAFGIYTV